MDAMADKETETSIASKIGKSLSGRLKSFGMSIGGRLNPYRVYKTGQSTVKSAEAFFTRAKRHFSPQHIHDIVNKATDFKPYEFAKAHLKKKGLGAVKQMVGHHGYDAITKGINKASNYNRANQFDYIMERINNNQPFREGIDFGSIAIEQMEFRPSIASQVDGVANANAIGTCDIRFKKQRKQGYYTYYNVSLELFINMLKRKGRGGTVSTPAGAWSYFMHNNQQYFAVKEAIGRDKAVKFAYNKQRRGGLLNAKQKQTARTVLPIKQIWLTKNNNKPKQIRSK